MIPIGGKRNLRLRNESILKSINTRVNVAAGAAETIVAQYQFPAGFLKQYDRIRIYATFSKSGTTDTGVITFRVGTAGTAADTSVFTGNALNAASRVLGAIHDFKLASATTLQHCGTGGVGPMNGSYIGVNGTAYPAAVTISDISNSLYLTVTVTPGATDDIALEDMLFAFLPTP